MARMRHVDTEGRTPEEVCAEIESLLTKEDPAHGAVEEA